MKRNYKILLIVTALTVFLLSFIPKQPNDKDKAILDILQFVLEKAHYSPAKLDDDFSKKVFDYYLEALDPGKRYFLESDFVEFKKHESKIDDYIKDRDLTFFDLTHTRLLQRIDESKKVYTDILSKPMNLNDDETVDFDFDKLGFAKDKNAHKERWRKQLEYSILSSVLDKEKLDKEKAETDKSYKPKSLAELEVDARTTTKKNLDNTFTNIKDLERTDWFGMYVNAILNFYDPHTSYFSPEDKDRWDTSMAGKFEGIGARLMKKNEGIEVSELISGGPAWKGKLLEQGDIILKVGQDNEEPMDVDGMKLDDVIKKIKGPKGTLVKLTVRKVDGTIKIIPIVRDLVETEETFAKSSIVQKEGSTYGVINLPAFYIDFENRQSRNCYTDVAKEIEKLKEANVQGIIMDLRNNGGGSLEMVKEIVGLFIEKGPVVQVKNAGGNILPPLSDTNPKVLWDGPLVVMVNGYSASASEIFAAAIQDYNRGLIIGGKQTYGKGTVQNFFELSRFLRNNNLGDIGSVKTTTQKYYRINGGSTQLEGVKSDIIIPDRLSAISTGEKDEKSALPWDKIPSTEYVKFPYDFSAIIENSKKRINDNSYFKLVEENAKWIKERVDNKVETLNYAKYKKEQEQENVIINKYKTIDNFTNSLAFKSLPYEEELLKTDDLLKEKRNRWHEELSKDLYITESLMVLDEISKMQKPVTVKEKKIKRKPKDKRTAMR